jgi:uncharacterized membrane protein
MTKTSKIKPSTTALKYIPGVCNIGPAERAKRRQGGIIALIISIVLLVLLITISAPKDWRLVLILPLSAAATGFLQDAFHFCAGFGMKGLYNVLNSQGITDNVISEEFRKKDRNKALNIIGLSFFIGLVVSGLTLLIPK